MRFEPAASEQDANLIFRSSNTLPPAENCGTATRVDIVARTYQPGVVEAAGVVALSIENTQENIACLATETGKDPGELLDLGLNGDVSHEIGHVLGFAHPEEIGRSYIEFERYWTQGLSEEEQEEEAEVPNLMTADGGNYLREMEAFLQRPMRVSDIHLSPIEAGALRLRAQRLERERAHIPVPANFCMPHTSSFKRADLVYKECIIDMKKATAIHAGLTLLHN